MTKFNPTNVRSLREAIRLYGPEHFNISAWFMTPEPDPECDPEDYGDAALQYALSQSDRIDINNCGTTACIAGHAVCLTHGELNQPEEVMEWLGVEEWVFYDERWPNWAIHLSDAHDDNGYTASLALLDALLATGYCPADCEQLHDPTHA